MAVLSQKDKFLMIHITKCAGSSLSEAFSEMSGYSIDPKVKNLITTDGIGGGVPSELAPCGIHVHDPYHVISKKTENTIELDQYFKFCFIRNPWDRIYSFYQHKLRRRDADLPKKNGRFLGFNDALQSSNVLLLQPQMWWMCDKEGTNKMDFIGKYEQLNDDYLTVCDHLGLTPKKILHRNKSTNNVKYQQAYSEESRRLIYYHYQHEIEHFGYKFNSQEKI